MSGSKTIQGREAFRYLVERQLQTGTGVPFRNRLEDAVKARRCRNIFFSAMAPMITDNGGAIPADTIVQAQTQRFASPIIVTDMLNFDEPAVTGFWFGVVWQLVRVFTSGAGIQQDFFGAGGLTNSLMTLEHIQSRDSFIGALLRDGPSLKQRFMPYILQPNEIFEINFEFMDVGVARHQVNPEVDFRGVQVLNPTDAYGDLCGKLREQVCNYIKRYDPETFFLIKRIPVADFPAAGGQIILNTEVQERPLLVLGMATNINGAQIQLFDNSVFWRFCVPPIVPRTAVNAGAVVGGNYGNIQGLPINVVAGNPELTLHEAYNIFPVPHLLAPNTALTITLTNGLRSDGLTGTFIQTMDTDSQAGTENGEGYITFLCRSV